MEFFGLFSGITCLVLAVMLVLAGLTVVLARWMGGGFRKVSGWDALAQCFPGPVAAPQDTRTGPLKIGMVYFRYGPRVCPTPEGLYLGYQSIYSYPPLLIPWSEFTSQRPAVLYWQSARCLEIGSPPITSLTFKDNMYRWIEPHLPAAARGQEV